MTSKKPFDTKLRGLYVWFFRVGQTITHNELYSVSKICYNSFSPVFGASTRNYKPFFWFRFGNDRHSQWSLIPMGFIELTEGLKMIPKFPDHQSLLMILSVLEIVYFMGAVLNWY